MLKKPMLAAALEDANVLRYDIGWVASPKLDGIRCLVIDGVAVSRNLKPIRNKYVQFLFGRKEYNGLDGELIVGEPTSPTCYTDTNSGVMSEDGKPNVRFHIFDRFDLPDQGFRVRYGRLPHDDGCVVRVPHHFITTKQQLLDLEEQFLNMGYEGLMLRHPDGPYKQNRSTLREGYLLKFKRFEDSEARIEGFEELFSNQNEAKKSATGHTERSTARDGLVAMDTLGAMLVRDIHTGVDFKIGSGFTAAQRNEFWSAKDRYVGKIVVYKFFPIGVKDKPRFPIFKGFRSEDDI